jgi:hydrogenase maturation protein HypF
MLERRFNTPLTSSAGRLFDAVAAIAGLRQDAEYEGQAAMELEWQASDVVPDRSYPFGLETVAEGGRSDRTIVVDTRPLIRAVACDSSLGVEAARIARRFHSTMVGIIVTVCNCLRQATGLSTVALSGGVFANALLTAEAEARLRADGFQVYRQTLVPPNDGGLSLGQLAIAAARSEKKHKVGAGSA